MSIQIKQSSNCQINKKLFLENNYSWHLNYILTKANRIQVLREFNILLFNAYKNANQNKENN